MGIKELGSFLQQNCPDAIYNVKLSDKKGCVCAIDVSLFMYKFKYSKGEDFLEKFIEQINRLKVNNITPIYVFDGLPPKEKTDTITERKDKKNEYKEQIKILKEQQTNVDNETSSKTIEQEIEKINKKLIYVTKDNINQLKYMLDLLNIKYIHKDCEADLINSKLSSEGYVDMVISEDMDHLTNGTKYLIRDFNEEMDQDYSRNPLAWVCILSFGEHRFLGCHLKKNGALISALEYGEDTLRKSISK